MVGSYRRNYDGRPFVTGGRQAGRIEAGEDKLAWLVGEERSALMAEGLNPIETGKKLHEHGKAGHERAEEADDRSKSDDRHSRIVQIGEAILLALVTITAAWAGYSAARWGTESRVEIAQSSTLRNLATRDDLTAISLRNFDAATFNAWFIAFTLNSPQKEAIAVRRFRPAIPGRLQRLDGDRPAAQPAFPARPDVHAPVQAARAGAGQRARQRGPTRNSTQAIKPRATGDNYVRITVFLAAVLFLVGIGSSFKLHGVRYALIVFGSALLVLSIVLIVQQPGIPS